MHRIDCIKKDIKYCNFEVQQGTRVLRLCLYVAYLLHQAQKLMLHLESASMLIFAIVYRTKPLV
jgi:hypothetical protein